MNITQTQRDVLSRIGFILALLAILAVLSAPLVWDLLTNGHISNTGPDQICNLGQGCR